MVWRGTTQGPVRRGRSSDFTVYMATGAYLWRRMQCAVVLSKAVLTVMVLLVGLAAYPATAESLEVATDQVVYNYGDTLTILITVEDVTEPFATLYIKDAVGKTSSPIHIPVEQQVTVLPAPAPFDRTVYPEGVYVVDVAYDGMMATTTFDLVDVGTVVVSNWIKEIAYAWIMGDISGIDYLKILGSLVDEGLVSGNGGEPFIPDWLAVPTAWWLAGLISDETFVTMLQYMVDADVVTGLAGTA